jgi:hypothetical protein
MLRPISMIPARAGSLASIGMASSRLPQRTSTCAPSLGQFGADLLEVGREEVDHALGPYRQFVQWLRRTDSQRLVVVMWGFHHFLP